MDLLLQIANGGKVYGGLHAIDSVNFELYAGAIHALLSENGADKSTLCKAIAGAIVLTSGDDLIENRRVAFSSPKEALEGGVATVYQESSLVPSTTVARNLELGMEKWFTIDSKNQHRSHPVAAIHELQRRSARAGREPRYSQASEGRDCARCASQRPGLHLR